MTTIDMIKVITAYNNGEKIQFRAKTNCYWENCESPIWNFNEFEYRVSPGPKIIPYRNKHDFVSAMKHHGPCLIFNNGLDYFTPTRISDTSIQVQTDDRWLSYTYELLATEVKWQDGTRCGIIEI